jgi:dephospho-CoA kinase
VFADPRQRADLEAIMHPAIRAEMERASAAAQEPYQLLVIPLFVETGRHTSVDRVLVVDCPEELQIRRVMARDNTTEERAREALAAQASREERRACADDVIVNDGDIATLRDAVESLHRRYLTLAVYASGPRQAE